jgi:hypothetical protein
MQQCNYKIFISDGTELPIGFKEWIDGTVVNNYGAENNKCIDGGTSYVFSAVIGSVGQLLNMINGNFIFASDDKQFVILVDDEDLDTELWFGNRVIICQHDEWVDTTYLEVDYDQAYNMLCSKLYRTDKELSNDIRRTLKI